MKKFVYLLIIFSIIFPILFIISSTTSFFVFNLSNNNVPNFIFPLVIIGLSVYISGKAYNAYQRKMDLEEATKKLRKIREAYKERLVVLDKPILEEEEHGKEVSFGRRFPVFSLMEVYYPIPPSLVISSSEYESQGVRLIKKVAPYEWEKARHLLRDIIIDPYRAPPNSQNEKEKEEFEKIKYEWEKIKKNIVEKSKEIYNQIDSVEKLKRIWLTVADNLFSLFPFAGITHPDILLPPKEAIKSIYDALRDLEEISIRNPFLSDYCETITTVAKKLVEIYKSGSFNKEIEKEVYDEMFRLEKVKRGLDRLLSSLDPANIHLVLNAINFFINSKPEIRIELIARGIITETHETAHSIIERVMRKYFGDRIILKIYEDPLLLAISEGFAMAYSFYHLLSEIEKGSISPKSIKPLIGDVKLFLIGGTPYYFGAKLFGLKEICEKIENVNFSNLSPEEFKKVVGDLKGEIRERIVKIVEALRKNREIVISEESWESRYEKLIKELYQQ